MKKFKRSFILDLTLSFQPEVFIKLLYVIFQFFFLKRNSSLVWMFPCLSTNGILCMEVRKLQVWWLYLLIVGIITIQFIVRAQDQQDIFPNIILRCTTTQLNTVLLTLDLKITKLWNNLSQNMTTLLLMIKGVNMFSKYRKLSINQCQLWQTTN